MDKKRKIDVRDSIRVVTSNEFLGMKIENETSKELENKKITTSGYENLSIKARKLLYLAISQCKKTDKEFFEYELKIEDFAKIMGIGSSNVYKEGKSIAKELMAGVINFEDTNGKDFSMVHVFAQCQYQDGIIKFKLDDGMTDMFLRLKKNFTQPLLADFMKMKNTYSMQVWHLMQKYMGSKKPYGDEVIEFDISIDELRKATDTEDKFERISDVKRFVLDRAIKDIENNCGVKTKYTNLKKGRAVVGFHFITTSLTYGVVLPPEKMDRIEKMKEYLQLQEKGLVSEPFHEWIKFQ